MIKKLFPIRKICLLLILSLLMLSVFGCDVLINNSAMNDGTQISEGTNGASEEKLEETEETTIETIIPKNTTDKILVSELPVDFSAPYATYSIINTGAAVFYKQNTDYIKKDSDKNYVEPKGLVVAVNAGHGTKGGANIKVFSHPDHSPKAAGGTTEKGEILSMAVSDGTTLNDGMREAKANLIIAQRLKDKLLTAGYDVLMIRDGDDVQLDNIARTSLANKYADCHVAIHFDYTTSDKGIFYITPTTVESYLNMEPLRSNRENIDALGKSLIEAFRDIGEKIWKDKGILYGDLTQLSYSTNASVDIELGDRATILTEEKIERLAEGLKNGIENYLKVYSEAKNEE